jgi:hypothetical protein
VNTSQAIAAALTLSSILCAATLGTAAPGPAQLSGTQNSAPAQRNFHGNGPHRGDWLRKYGNLPPEQLRQQLEQDNDFRNLPAERQQRLRQRLEHFNSMPPQQKARILKRMELMEQMPPEQQKRVEGLFQQFHALDPERRRAVVQQLRYLRTLPVDQRAKALDSLKSGFNDQEQQLLRGLNDLGSQMESAGVKGPGM